MCCESRRAVVRQVVRRHAVVERQNCNGKTCTRRQSNIKTVTHIGVNLVRNLLRLLLFFDCISIMYYHVHCMHAHILTAGP